jgi:quercetin dioxygenase-like cupin family protein
MKKKISFPVNIVAAIALVSLLMPDFLRTPQQGIKRTELQRYDLSTRGREMIQVRVDFAEGASFGKHSHPGEEVVYVIEGTFEYYVEGKGTVTLKAGDVLFIPAGVNHSAKNTGNSNAAELATYIVEKGKQLVVMAKNSTR